MVIASVTVGANQTAAAPTPDPAPEHPPAHINCTYRCVQRVKAKIRHRLRYVHAADRRHARYLLAKELAGMHVATASWYYDTGQTACGTHYRYGVAHKTLPCGTRVRICGPGRCVTATVQDRGPFIAGRSFDLNPALKAATGCGDLCAIHWKLDAR